MDATQFKKAGYQAIDKIAEYYDNIEKFPVRSEVHPGFLREALPLAAPDDGEDWQIIHEDVERIIQPGLCHWPHPGFMAYFPASSTFEGILGELYSAAFNGPAFDWVCSPSVTELENVMMDWIVKLLGLPDGFHSGSQSQGGGIIMDSTTESLIATMVAARDRYLRSATRKLKEIQSVLDEDEIRKRLVVLGSSETHPATAKAASIIGVKYRSIEVSPIHGTLMTEGHLETLIHRCYNEGLIPFFLTATLGSTNSCAVDDMDGIRRILRDFPEIWVHVDAAFAGTALAHERYRHLSAKMEDFQSISVNLGKWLLTNLDCTALLVQHTPHLTDSLSSSCAILSNKASASGRVIDYRNWQLSMGRRFRALKVWFVLRSWGVKGIQQHIGRHLDMADQMTSWIESRPDLFELVTKPQFALNAIRVNPELARQIGVSADVATIDILDAVNSTKEFWLSKTVLDGMTAIRIVSASPKSNIKTLRRLFDRLVEFTEAMAVPLPNGNHDEMLD